MVSHSQLLPNCLLIGDSVTNGQAALVASLLRNECMVQHVENTGSDYEASCFGTSVAVDTLGDRISWDVIQYNEGLHHFCGM